MSVRIRTSAVVLVAAAGLATAWALAAAVQPSTHRFVTGEHFRYSNVFRFVAGTGEGVIADDRPMTITAAEEIHVVDVSASGATLTHHIEVDKAAHLSDVSSAFTTHPTTIGASRDGTWHDADGGMADNFVTWDPMQLGAQPAALTPGQHWNVGAPHTVSSAASRAMVRVVSVDPDNLTLHVEGIPEPPDNGTFRTRRWYADWVFEHGIVRELHRVSVLHTDQGAGAPGIDDRLERRIRLVSHTTP